MTVKLKGMTPAQPPVVVLAALREEVDGLTRGLRLSGRGSPRLSIWEGELEGKSVVVVLSGVGKVAAAMATQFACDELKPGRLLTIGLAGGINSEKAPGHVIVASGAVEHDVDARPLTAARGVLPGFDAALMPADPGIAGALLLAAAGAADDPRSVRSGVVLTGDQIVTSREVRNRVLADFPEGACFDMETAAVAHVARQNDIPWGGVRITSDAADESFSVDEVLGFGASTAAGLFDRIVRAFLAAA
jgi:adenosylhomocysteine nucleosidase